MTKLEKYFIGSKLQLLLAMKNKIHAEIKEGSMYCPLS
jgi:hypothetical protein